MRILLAASLALALTASAAAPLYAETLEEIYAKAKAEGALSIYGGGPARLYEGWVKEYEARFPGIKVTVTGGYAGGLAPAIDKQIADRKLDVDFVNVPGGAGIHPLEAGGRAAAVQDGWLRRDRSALSRPRRCLYADQRLRYRARLQYPVGGTGRRAQVGA